MPTQLLFLATLVITAGDGLGETGSRLRDAELRQFVEGRKERHQVEPSEVNEEGMGPSLFLHEVRRNLASDVGSPVRFRLRRTSQ